MVKGFHNESNLSEKQVKRLLNGRNILGREQYCIIIYEKSIELNDKQLKPM